MFDKEVLKMKMKHKVNIYELAEASGFSVSTVSKALNHTGRISEATRQKILAIASKLNYIPSYHAKALSLNKSWIIGIIYSDNLGIGFSHPHFSVILEGFKQEAERQGYEITFINRNMGNRPMTYLEFCQYRHVEGVFIVNYYSLSKQVPQLIESGLPLVSADAGFDHIPTITSNDLLGGVLATQYLYNLGHRKIDHIAGPSYTVSAQNRKKGFMQVVKDNQDIISNIYEANNYSIEDGYHQALQIIEKKDLPTAIFVAGDWMALGVIQALKEHQIKVPEDISVIGYDNLEFLKYSQPALTTVSQNKLEIGKRAAQYLIQQINGETVSSLSVDVEIIERDTCQKRL
jgi:DNA-binding LacI/PurR family transcriptional regulator